MKNVELRFMKADDISAVEKLETECFPSPWSTASITEIFNNPNTVFVVAELDGKVVGYGSMFCVVDEGQILKIAVSKDVRRQGIGHKTVDFLIRTGIERGLVFFTLEVRKSNEPAIALYNSFGFKAVGIRPEYYENREDAIFMELDL